MHQNARFCYISETLMSSYLLNILPRFFIKNFSQRQQQRYCAPSPKELHSFVEEYFQLTMIRCCMIFLFMKICAQWHFLGPRGPFVEPSILRPSTRPVRNDFSWVHRWAGTLPPGLRYPSNHIFSESWWCQLSKFGQKYKYKDKYRDKYKYRDK